MFLVINIIFNGYGRVTATEQKTTQASPINSAQHMLFVTVEYRKAFARTHKTTTPENLNSFTY